jgi:hypothetical protein
VGNASFPNSTVVGAIPDTFISLGDVAYALKCRPTQRMF